MKAFEVNWKQKSIENLEKDVWGFPPKDSSNLVNRVYQLRTVQIEKLEPKDLRLLIGQVVGLKYMIPHALDILQGELFIEVEFYNGDLLQTVMNVENNFWIENGELKIQLDKLIENYSEEERVRFRNGKFKEFQ